MASTRKYDIDHISSNVFIKTFRREKPRLIQSTKTEDCERLAKDLIHSIQNALEQSCPKMVQEDKIKQSIINRVPSNVADLFLISKNLLSENRKQNRSGQYSNARPNYSKYDFFEKQLDFYVGDQISNRLVNKKFARPTNAVQIEEEAIRKIIDRLASGKMPGLDFIPNEIWQCILRCDQDYLFGFIRILLNSYYFPKVFKESKLIVFRKPNRAGYHPENYRFITVQSSFCKIYEKLIIQKLKDGGLMDYLGRVDNQHGFTKNKSRFSALNLIVNEMRSIRRSYEYGILIQLDFKRAFDLIAWDHILKVAENNLSKEQVILIAQLLKDRKIKLNEFDRDIHRGLPQGSSSSHLLWLLGTSDLMLKLSSIQNLLSVGFVDDLGLIVKGQNPKEVINKVNQVKSVLENWLKSSALQLNENKCVYMQFNGRLRINLNRLEIGGTKLRSVNEVKYLGVHLSSKLNFDSQIRNILMRMKDAIKAIQVINSYSLHDFTYKEKFQIYKRAIEPIITNGYSVWWHDVINKKKFIDQLRNVQKKCLVILFGECYEMRNVELCRKHKIYPIDIELEIKINLKKNADLLKRRLSKRECDNIRLAVMQKNNFHF